MVILGYYGNLEVANEKICGQSYVQWEEYSQVVCNVRSIVVYRLK